LEWIEEGKFAENPHPYKSLSNSLPMAVKVFLSRWGSNLKLKSNTTSDRVFFLHFDLMSFITLCPSC